MILLLLLLTGSTLSLVVPHADSNTGLTGSSSSSSPPSNDLTKLHIVKTQSNSLICHANNQRMSCYGSIPVTLQTCRDICVCENGRISCPTYKYCDDATMDTFCGGMCGCSTPSTSTSSNSNSNSPPSNLRVGGNYDDKDHHRDETMLSNHRYPAALSTRMYGDEDDDWEEDDDEDMFQRRAKRRVTDSRPVAGQFP